MDRCCKPPNPRVKKSASVNEQIIDYYFKFGHNRDLDKYLRLRRSYNKSKSSSEGSLPSGEHVEHWPSCSRAFPGNVSCPSNIANVGVELEEADKAKTEVIRANSGTQTDKEKDNDKNIATVSVSTTKKVEEDEKRAYSFNCESNIAISILPPPLQSVVSMPELNRPPVLHSEASQTISDEFTPVKGHSVPDSKPTASAQKSHKRLEWDSLGDVGYDPSTSQATVSTLERSVLREFFAERGIQISFPTELSKKSQPPREKWREVLQSVKKKYASPSTSSKSFDVTKEFADLPQSSPLVVNALKSKRDDCGKREKYCQTSLRTQTSRDVQTSPVTTANHDKCEQANFTTSTTKSNLSSPVSEKVELQASTSINSPTSSVINSIEAKTHDKCEQANFATNEKVELHASTSRKRPTSSVIQSSDAKTHDKCEQTSLNGSSDTDKQLEVTKNTNLSYSSSDKPDKLKNCPVIPIQSVLKEVITPKCTPLYANNSAEEIPRRHLKSEIVESNKKVSIGTDCNSLTKKADFASNFSKPIEDKQVQTSSRNTSAASEAFSMSSPSSFEFVRKDDVQPRAALKEIHSNSTKSSENSKNKAISEVDLGVQLLCQLIEAKNLTEHQKKVLTRRIVTKISRKHGGGSISSCVSESSAISEQSLIESAKKSTSSSGKVRKNDESDFQAESSRSSADQDTMREWLDPLTDSEKKFDKYHRLKESGADEVVSKERKSHLNWIETEIQRLQTLKQLLQADKDPGKENEYSSTAAYDTVATSTSRSSKPSANVLITIEESLEDVVNPADKYKRSIRRETENIVMYDEVQPERSRKTKITIDEEQRFPRRSKMQTPPIAHTSAFDASVRSFAQQRKQEFLKHYSQKVHSYDRPELSAHYSEPHANSKPDAYTSLDFCASGSSEMSIPIASSGSTTTTTHQYDNRCGVGVQTTDSILKTRPIFKCSCRDSCQCSCSRPTLKTFRSVCTQQTQVKPKAVAYVIKFQERDSSSDLSSRSTRSPVSVESLTLQEHLRNERPEFCIRASERQKILKEINHQRQRRDEQIRAIIENTSINSIPRKLNELPPPPTKNIRIFATKEMKERTKKKYSQLPEVVQKLERLKLEKRKRSNKILTDVFNKKLQRRVHKGKLSLEHSRTVI